MRITGTDAGNFAQGQVAWDVLNAVRQHAHTPLAKIDLSECIHLKPYSVATLAAIGVARTSATPLALALPNSAECSDHLHRLGLPTLLGVPDAGLNADVRDTNVPAQQIQSGPGAFSSRALSVWETQLGGLDPGIASALADHLDEVILNALAHSGSRIGCIVAGQAFPKTKKLEVAIVDLGRTIRGHLSANPKYASLTDDETAILKATEEGVTGTIDLNGLGEPNSGVGLYELRRYCETGGGELTLLSGTRYVTFAPGQAPVIREFRGGFSGCLVNVRFFADFAGS